MKSAIDHYNQTAKDYDNLAKKYHLLSNDTIFGLLFEYLSKGQKLLDIGIGTGISSMHFHKYGLRVYGVDGSRQMLNKSSEKRIAEELKLVDLQKEKIPYANNTFDLVVADGLLYFFSDPSKIIKEVGRVLRTNGKFALNFEDSRYNPSSSYITIDKNTLVSKDVLDSTGVFVYSHNLQKMKRLLNKDGFAVLKTLNYMAYTSPSTKKDVYFTAVIAQKS